MATATPDEAWMDFTPTMRAKMPIAGYRISVKKQKFLPAVSNLPSRSFRLINNTATKAELTFDETPLTGQNLLWLYTLNNIDGHWLIDNVRRLGPAH
jgi:hypothetical protein